MIQLQQITLQRGQKILFEHANLMIHAGQKVGIIGNNGTGKSSLFMLLQNELTPDHGEVSVPKHLKFAHIEQHIPSGSQSAIDYALQGDREYAELQIQLQAAEKNEDGMQVATIHHRLAEIDGYAAPSNAAKILLGLGFSQTELSQPINSFSGGWRMRLNLARVLMSRADLLLLDEPTNHLDLEAIIWLEEWLAKSKQTILIISHDRDFLDYVVTHIAHVENKTLSMYTGNYSAFEQQRAEQLALQQATFEKQQRTRAHLQKFVDRFRYKASKAKQAQSRIKMLERMQLVEAVHISSPFGFSFKPITPAGTPMIQLRHATVGYDNNNIFENISCSIGDGDRIGLIGPNGAGKSTFIKMIADKLQLKSGECIKSNKIKLGYFAQHQLEQLDNDKGVLAHLYDIAKGIKENDARRYLGGFNFHGDDVFRPVREFSGGERARLVLALLIWQAPNLLLLDEPTNHLDLEMREALNLALQEYEGAMILVSHDRHLLKSSINDLWLVANKKIQPFLGDMDDYRNWLAEHYSMPKEEIINKPKPARTKNEITLLQKQLDKLEKQLDNQQNELVKIDNQLSDNETYSKEKQNELEKLNIQRNEAMNKIHILEEEILKLMHQMEEK